MKRYGYGYRFRYSDMKLWRSTAYMSESSWDGCMDEFIIEIMMEEVMKMN
jgi:hypothetical protein